MTKYLGTVIILNTYVNFMPFYSIDRHGALIRMTTAERYGLFPESEIANINIYSQSEDRNTFAERFDQQQLYIVDLDEALFEDNVNYYGEYNKTRYKINLDELGSSKYGSIDAFGYYYYLDKSEFAGDVSKSYLLIGNSSIQKGFKVVLEIDGHKSVAGPFSVSQRMQDGEPVVVTHKKDRRSNDLNIVDVIETSYSSNDIQEIQIEERGTGAIKTYHLFYANGKNTSVINVISDENLIKEFKDTISKKVAENGTLDLSKIDGLVESYKSAGGSLIPPEIRDQRAKRIKTLLSEEKVLDEQSEQICQLIADIIASNKNSNALDPVFKKLSENAPFMNSVHQNRIMSAKLQALDDEIQMRNQEIQQLDAKIKDKKTEEIEANFSKDYDEWIAKIEAAKNEFKALESSIEELRGAKTAQEHIEYLRKENDYLERTNLERRMESDAIEKNIDSLFSNKTEKALSLTFDGMISQKMINAAAEWETDRQNRQYSDLVEEIIKTSREPMSANDLTEYLYNSIHSYRPNYDKNTIMNLFVCMAQGFLTVFSGAPGAGKTSICKIMSHTLGLTLPSKYVDESLKIDPNRYIDVSVERGWTSKRDFIGYYNPLTKKFDRNNSRLFDALNILDVEAKGKKTDRPFVILLDEANLSPMEYYWADFMNVCDDLDENSSIDLGEEYIFNIPDELRFIATINNDHTTESLSPRLIDRAWVIRLPNAKPGLGKTTVFTDDNKEILWSEFVSVFGCEEGEITGSAKEIYDEFISKAKKINIRVSPRSDSAIRRYWSVASKLMERDENAMADSSIVALDYAIAQKILPQISGSGEIIEEGLKDMMSYSQDMSLNMTATLLDEIITRGQQTMQFFQYFG